jgi:hypothetical protein
MRWHTICGAGVISWPALPGYGAAENRSGAYWQPRTPSPDLPAPKWSTVAEPQANTPRVCLGDSAGDRHS